MLPEENKILVIDFGSQYTQLIARVIRENGVYCEIFPPRMPFENIVKFNPSGIILSGGPSSVYDEGAPGISKEIFNLGKPLLGICYGLQLIVHLFGGEVKRAKRSEYGYAMVYVEDDMDLFERVGKIVRAEVMRQLGGLNGFRSQRVITRQFRAWMSHSDEVVSLPPGFESIAHTENTDFAGIRNKKLRIWAVQFHPEVSHTEDGEKIIQNFLFKICGCKKTWNLENFVEKKIAEIKEQVGENYAVCALSGGVDSSVSAILVHRSIGDRLISVFVDNGLLRAGEKEFVQHYFGEKMKMNLKIVEAKDRFLNNLRGVADPEKKRKIIGETFIRVFEDAVKDMPVKFLVQGTTYPDLIESRSVRGPSATIKTHHNVGGLPEKMRFELIEPLKELFKDEVRKVGKILGLPEEIINKHPFPGPGLAVRIIGEVKEEDLEMLREADTIVVEEIKKAELYEKLWQAFAVLLPVKSVGVMGDRRTYERVIALRIVESKDGMTADWAKIPHDVLQRISTRIVNEVKGVNRVVYDITTKPPSTIEWE